MGFDGIYPQPSQFANWKPWPSRNDMDFPIEIADVPVRYVELPEAIFYKDGIKHG